MFMRKGVRIDMCTYILIYIYTHYMHARMCLSVCLPFWACTCCLVNYVCVCVYAHLHADVHAYARNFQKERANVDEFGRGLTLRLFPNNPQLQYISSTPKPKSRSS